MKVFSYMVFSSRGQQTGSAACSTNICVQYGCELNAGREVLHANPIVRGFTLSL